MKQTTERILERSSDPIMIIRMADGAVLGINEAFFAVTGHPQHELTGRQVGDLFVPLRSVEDQRPAGVEPGGSAEPPVALWTRTGELRCGELSVLLVDVDGQRDAVCSIRGVREPTPAERRLAALERFTRIVDSGGAPLEVVISAIRALGESLRWELGALWLTAPGLQTMGCVAVWRAPLADLKALEAASWRTRARLGAGLVGRTWRDRQAGWVSDARSQRVLDPRLHELGDLVHGWFGFPVWSGGEVVGVVEFFSRAVREPDEKLSQMTEQFGDLLGRVLADGEQQPASPHRNMTHTTTASQGPVPPRSERVSSALRDLEKTVAAGIGKLDRLLEGVAGEHPAPGPAGQPAGAVSSDRPPPKIPSGLTLKAVSGRTGIPAATLRTWERRYHFLRPERATNGYRRYGEEEIARILQVKHLLEQGVRIAEAMETVEGSDPRRATG
jgi:PAS domain S-box-containing protein